MLYEVITEPSIGLHQRDNNKLIKTLINLRDLGNTVIVVEHDSDTIASADHVLVITSYSIHYTKLYDVLPPNSTPSLSMTASPWGMMACSIPCPPAT